MATTKVAEGKVMNHLAAADLNAGDVVEFGADADGFAGIALADIANGSYGPVAVTECYTVPKETGAGTGFPAGTKVYWTGTVATETSTANHLMGYAWKTSADADATCVVKLGG